MKKVILAIIASVFVLTDVGAVTRIQCRIDTARRVVVIPAVEGGADVAVAVIDRSIGVPDTTVTIASQLLMQSDLRGHVEDAAWYLRTPRREAGPAADALMLTQGWTRYDMPAAIRGEINDSLPYPLEIGAQLDGVIRSKWRGKPLTGVTVKVLAPRMADGAVALTDSLGHFCITGLEWPDSTFLVISATNRKGKLEENINPEFDFFPRISTFSEPELETSANISSSGRSDNESEWNLFINRLAASPQGMHNLLEEVVVHGRRPRNASNAIDYLASVYIRPGEDRNIQSYEIAVAGIPGVNIINDKLMYHQTPVAVWVDGRYLGSADGASRIRNSTSLSVYRPSYNSVQSSDFGLGNSASMAEVNSAIYGQNQASYSSSGLLHNQLNISELEAMYPFLENESVAYIPPHLSTLVRREGHTRGGVLNITTKNPGKVHHTLSPEFKCVTPLGYQRPKSFYVPEYIADTDPDIPRGATLTWIPSACPVESIAIPIPPSADINHLGIIVEGFDGNGHIVDTVIKQD